MNKNLYLLTSDLSLAATISIWFPLEKIDRSKDPRRVLFVFKRSREIEAFVDKYWKKEILVEPRKYFDALKAMKGRLYAHE